MISIKTPREIELLRIAGEITGSTHNYLKPFIKPGITTKELDDLAYDYIIKRGATPSFKGYDGFPGTICASVNEEVVHGIPSKEILFPLILVPVIKAIMVIPHGLTQLEKYRKKNSIY